MSYIVYTIITFILNLSSWISLTWCVMWSLLFLPRVKHLRCFPGKDSKHFHKKWHVAILKAKQVYERHMAYLWHEQSHYHWTICRNKAAHPKRSRKHEYKHNFHEIGNVADILCFTKLVWKAICFPDVSFGRIAVNRHLKGQPTHRNGQHGKTHVYPYPITDNSFGQLLDRKHWHRGHPATSHLSPQYLMLSYAQLYRNCRAFLYSFDNNEGLIDKLCLLNKI